MTTVGEVMRPQPHCIDADAPIGDAHRLMGAEGLRHLPVFEDGNLVGLLSERDLLRLFAQRPGMPIARHELAADESTGSERAIDVQINRLRRKIEGDPANPVYLQTVRGKGYILHTD